MVANKAQAPSSMSKQICAKCGAVQQWEMWRNCSCGYEFPPAVKPPARPPPLPPPMHAPLAPVVPGIGLVTMVGLGLAWLAGLLFLMYFRQTLFAPP